MTANLRYPGRQSEFSDWLRGLSGNMTSTRFSNQNLDYIWHEYVENWLITIEEKTHGGRSTYAQCDTHGIVAQMLQHASGIEVQTGRGKRRVEYRGHYVVRFEKTTPNNSSWIRINGKAVDQQALLHLLNTGVANL